MSPITLSISKITKSGNSLPRLPRDLYDKFFVQELMRKNWRILVDPPHWRLTVEEIKSMTTDFLCFAPPSYHVFHTVRDVTAKTFYFYQWLVAKQKVEKGEKIYGEVKVEEKPIYFIDGFTSPRFMKRLLEGWCMGQTWDSIGFTGNFLGARGSIEITIKHLKELFKAGEEASENYIYRCKGFVEDREFDVAIKRFLPRSPLDRGNREYVMMKSLPSQIVPTVYGGLINTSLTIKGEPQLLVLFSDFVEGKNVGWEIWDLIKDIIKARKKGEDTGKKIKTVHTLVKETITKVVFPFHKASYDRLSSLEEEDSTAYRIDVFMKEALENLRKLRREGLLTDDEEERYLSVLSRAWGKMLQNIVVTKIHGDLMWGQVIRSKKGDMVIVDLDEHAKGQPGKDIADLCAANRFIAEALPTTDKGFTRGMAEDLNKTILSSYLACANKSCAELGRALEETVSIYLAFRHLHDVVYHLPIWQGATDPATAERHKRYVELSLDWFKRSILKLEGMFASRS
jgi:hypothetical protein